MCLVGDVLFYTPIPTILCDPDWSLLVSGELRKLQGMRSWTSTRDLLIKPNNADVMLAVWTNVDAKHHFSGFDQNSLSEVVAFFKPCAVFVEHYNKTTMESISRQSKGGAQVGWSDSNSKAGARLVRSY